VVLVVHYYPPHERLIFWEIREWVVLGTASVALLVDRHLAKYDGILCSLCSLVGRVVILPISTLNCEKRFSTMSWFIMAGLIVDPGKSASLTIEMKPCTIIWRSNHNFSDRKCFPLSTWCFQSEKNLSAFV
jgi:hypothetical protein